ncbi:hypothetical protein ACR77J_07250 [Tissierella praeacuta]|uniref:hypothetical protein n=1 Tax=Tissierella praeacuta TaxID=43131 RepID=UPI003DA2B866
MSKFREKVEEDILQEDCEKLRQYDDKKWIRKMLKDELDKFVEDNKHTYEEVFVLYKYYGRILNRLKGDNL